MAHHKSGSRIPIQCARLTAGVTAHGANSAGTVCYFDQAVREGEGVEAFWRKFKRECGNCPLEKVGGINYWEIAKEATSAKPCGAC